jgi:succinyl-CoA synthetase beta subunit
VTTGDEAAATAAELGFPLALKMLSDRLPHKTEAGAVRLGLSSAEAVTAAIAEMRRAVAAYDSAALSDRFLLERMIPAPVAELMVSVRRDAQFGVAMTLASGGILIELIDDAVTILLPASRAELEDALGRLRISRLIEGYRGRPGGDRAGLIDLLMRLGTYGLKGGVVEVEINPLFVLEKDAVAVDVLMRREQREISA